MPHLVTTASVPSARDIEEAKNALLVGDPEVDALITLLLERPTEWRTTVSDVRLCGPGDVQIWVGVGGPYPYRPIETRIGWRARRRLRRAIKIAAALHCHAMRGEVATLRRDVERVVDDWIQVAR